MEVEVYLSVGSQGVNLAEVHALPQCGTIIVEGAVVYPVDEVLMVVVEDAGLCASRRC